MRMTTCLMSSRLPFPWGGLRPARGARWGAGIPRRRLPRPLFRLRSGGGDWSFGHIGDFRPKVQKKAGQPDSAPHKAISEPVRKWRASAG